MKIIGHIYTGFNEKFGIPRQSGLVKTPGRIVLDRPYNDPQALRGLDDFSHIWVIWDFSLARRKRSGAVTAENDEIPENDVGVKNDGNPYEDGWSPTVRPPRLGGNKRVGVFATRSPFRPNHMGLSCLEIEKIEWDAKGGPVIHVLGADMADGTPIYDIKPYIPYADCITDAKSGFAAGEPEHIEVEFGCGIPGYVTGEKAEQIRQLLAQDPRPSYKDEPERIYGMSYGGFEIRFKGTKEKITVIDILKK